MTADISSKAYSDTGYVAGDCHGVSPQSLTH